MLQEAAISFYFVKAFKLCFKAGYLLDNTTYYFSALELSIITTIRHTVSECHK